MTLKEIDQTRKLLIDWYRRHHRQLPWRETEDPYRIWVSEVMLQQTQVQTVLPYYQKFLLDFPDVKQLADADLQKVLKVWEGLGYYARARNMHRSAKINRKMMLFSIKRISQPQFQQVAFFFSRYSFIASSSTSAVFRFSRIA